MGATKVHMADWDLPPGLMGEYSSSEVEAYIHACNHVRQCPCSSVGQHHIRMIGTTDRLILGVKPGIGMLCRT